MDAYVPPSAYHSLVPSKNFNAHQISEGPTPSWVIPIGFPQPAPADPYQGSGEVLLYDTQIDTDSKTIYVHFVKRLLNADDLQEEGTLSLDFNPSYEALVVHTCEVTRNGQRIDKLNLDRPPFVCQREEALDNLVYSGDLTVSFIIDDLREGDILECSYSKTGLPPLFFKLFSQTISLQEKFPIERLYQRVVKSQNSSASITHIPNDYSSYLVETDSDWSWLIEPSPAFEHDYDLPQGYEKRPMAIINDTSCNELASGFASFFPKDPLFEANPEVKALIQSWQNATTDPKELATLAARFVQDEVRYFCLSDGIFGLRSIDPLFTFKSRFGDCKAKSLLLRSLLELLQIPAEVILVNSKGRVHEHPPADFFNHVIVRADLEGKSAFIETTAPYQGGDLFECFLPYRFGLACSINTETLDKIHISRMEMDIDRKIILQLGDEGEPSTLEVFSLGYGDYANQWRSAMRSYGKATLSQEIEEFYEPLFGSLTLLDEEFEDDRAKNCTSYRGVWNLDPLDFIAFSPTTMATILEQKIPENRTDPFYFWKAKTFRETLFLPGVETDPLEEVIDHEIFTFTRKDSNEEEGARVDFELVIHETIVEPELFDSLRAALEKASETATCFLDF